MHGLDDTARVDETASAPTAHLVADFDHHDVNRSATEIWRLHEQLPGTCPVAHVDRYGGFDLVSGYQEIKEVIAARQDFTSAGEGVFIPRPAGLPMLPALEFEGEQHRAWRKVFDGLLNPAAVRALEPLVLRIVDAHIDAFAERGTADLVPEFTHPVPGVVIGQMVGLTYEESWRNQELFDAQYSAPPEETELRSAYWAFLGEFLQARRQSPKDDFLTELTSGSYQGMEFDDELAIKVVLALLGGGQFSTASGLAGVVHHVLSDDELRRRLGEQPDIVLDVVNESLRLTTPLQLFARTAVADTTIGQCPVTSGSRVMLNFAAANRDPGEFDRPNEFVVDREHNRHLAFGYGAHICSGQHLARLELRVGLTRLLERLPDIRLDGEAEFTGMVGGNHMGISAMPVRFTPAPKVS